jgi:hypothetical protein
MAAAGVEAAVAEEEVEVEAAANWAALRRPRRRQPMWKDPPRLPRTMRS